MAASQTKPVYGLLGRKLGHSYSPRIHAMLGNYEYRLHEVEPTTSPLSFVKAILRG